MNKEITQLEGYSPERFETARKKAIEELQNLKPSENVNFILITTDSEDKSLEGVSIGNKKMILAAMLAVCDLI